MGGGGGRGVHYIGVRHCESGSAVVFHACVHKSASVYLEGFLPQLVI